MNLEQLLAPKNVTVESAVLKAAIEKNQKEKTDKLVTAVAGLLEDFQSTLDSNVMSLKLTRKEEKRQTKLVADLNRANEYFKFSGNPLPYYLATGNTRMGVRFLQNIGVDEEMWDTKHDAWKIPDDYQAK